MSCAKPPMVREFMRLALHGKAARVPPPTPPAFWGKEGENLLSRRQLRRTLDPKPESLIPEP